MPTENAQISLNPSAIVRILGAVAFLTIFASIGGQLSKFLLGHSYVKGLVPLFNLNRERNIPTFFSLLLMVTAALLLAVIAVLNGKQKTHDASKWAILSFGFLYMAYDEAFEIHERLTAPVRALLGSGNLGIFYYAWVIPGIVVVLVVALFFARFVLRLPAIIRRTFLMAAALYVGGSIGFELVGGAYAELHGSNNLTYNIISTAEESLEIAGLIVFLWALLKYCAHNYKEVRFRFGP